MMDPKIISYYRRLLRGGFPHIGKMENPDIFIDSLGEKIQVCGSLSHAYMHIYIAVEDGIIKLISYLCTCDPTANVVIEILCSLAEGRTLEEAEKLTEEKFVNELGNDGEEFLKRARGTIELVGRGLNRYRLTGETKYTSQ